MHAPTNSGHVFWLFGLSGAGKSTLAGRLIAQLRAEGRSVLALDGDIRRAGLCRGLGFSDSDRSENLRRAAEVARLGADSGLCVVASFITPLNTQRTLVRDGGSWSPQLELKLDEAGYYTLISLPLGHGAAEKALEFAAKPRAMKRLSGPYTNVRAARLRAPVGELDRTLVVVESEELLAGQKRGIARALVKAKAELRKLERQVGAGKMKRGRLEQRVAKALGREHLSSFVMTEIGGDEANPTLRYWVDAEARRRLETTRLGRRVLCTDRHIWSTERIVQAFRGQWNVEELFRRAKKGGIAPWGPSFQRNDGSLRLHTFATVLGLELVALAKLALNANQSAGAMLKMLGGIQATLVRTVTGTRGRRPTVMLPPELTAEQRRAVRTFELERWMPSLSSCR
jgi:hypothetical protein